MINYQRLMHWLKQDILYLHLIILEVPKVKGIKKGFPQSIIDLEKALDYIKSELDLNRFPIGLYGYSLGGYSVMNVSHKEYPIKAIIERSGPITLNRSSWQKLIKK